MPFMYFFVFFKNILSSIFSDNLPDNIFLRYLATITKFHA